MRRVVVRGQALNGLSFSQLDDQQFWTRYFQSKLFNRNRTTNRAAVNTIKDDDIFDKYLGEEDDGPFRSVLLFTS